MVDAAGYAVIPLVLSLSVGGVDGGAGTICGQRGGRTPAGREGGAFPHHLTLCGAADVVAAVREQGLPNRGAGIILAHLDAHHWPLHEEARALVAPPGWEIAFDGMGLVV